MANRLLLLVNMKSKNSKLILTALAISTVAFAADRTSKQKNVDRLRAASMTFEEIMATPDKRISSTGHFSEYFDDVWRSQRQSPRYGGCCRGQ